MLLMLFYVSFVTPICDVLLTSIAGIMAVDMYIRLLRRVSGDNKSKTQ